MYFTTINILVHSFSDVFCIFMQGNIGIYFKDAFKNFVFCDEHLPIKKQKI